MAARAAHASSAANPRLLPPPTQEGRIFHGPRERHKTDAWAARNRPLRKSPADRQPPNPVKVALNEFHSPLIESPHFTKEVFVRTRFHDVTVRPLLLGPVAVARSSFRCHQNDRNIHISCR